MARCTPTEQEVSTRSTKTSVKVIGRFHRCCEFHKHLSFLESANIRENEAPVFLGISQYQGGRGGEYAGDTVVFICILPVFLFI